MCESVLAKLIQALDYPQGEPRSVAASSETASFDFIVDGEVITATEEPTGDGEGQITFQTVLTHDADVAKRLAVYAAGRLTREEAVLAWDAEKNAAILWGRTALCRDRDDGALPHEIVRMFESFCQSADWWRDRVRDAGGGTTRESPFLKRIVVTLLLLMGCFCTFATSSIPWRVPNYSLTARGMDVREALETFAVAQGVPAVISEGVKGAFSGNFKDVPAKTFLDQVATIHNLTWYYDGATIWVYAAGETLTTLIDLRYMKAPEVLALMRELGVEDKRFPLKEASNSELIMVSGPPRYVTLVVDMISKADRLREQRTFTEIETRLFPLVHTWADNVSFSQTGTGLESSATITGVAYLLQEIMNDNARSATKVGTNNVEKADAGAFRPIIRPENRLNAVLVRDAATHMPMYEDLIKKLDRPQKLVEIAVTVMEMTKDDALDWQASVSVNFSDSRNTAGAGMNVDNLMTASSLAGLGASGGYSYLGDHINVDASILAEKTKGRARNVYRTSLLTLNNMMAEISDTESYSAKLVGEKVANVSETSAGTKLAIKPRIVEPPAGTTNAVPQIWLTLEMQDGGFDKLATVDNLPTKRTTTIQTQAALPENDSLLLAGYFRDIDEEVGWGIPYLRDIPWIGWLFGGASTAKTTVQRMFILTPHIVDLDAYKAATQDVSTVQMLRQRDVVNEMELEDAARKDDWYRKNREAAVKERRDIRDEREEEKFKRDERERDLRRDQREDARERDREQWEDDFKKRKEEWKKSKLGSYDLRIEK